MVIVYRLWYHAMFSLTSSLSWQEIGREWIFRIVATIALAVTWHVLFSNRQWRRSHSNMTTTSSHSSKDPEDSHSRSTAAVRQAFLNQLLLKEQEKKYKEEQEEGQEDVINREEEDCDDRVPHGNGDSGEDDDLYVTNSSLQSPNEERNNNQDQMDDDEASSKIQSTETTTPSTTSSDHHSSKAGRATVTSKATTPIIPTRPSRTLRPSTATTTHDTAAIVFHNTSVSLSSRLGRIRLSPLVRCRTRLYRIYRI